MPWDLSRRDIERIAIGAGILGTGGGGNPRHGRIRTQNKLDEGYRLRVLALDELPDDALVVPIGGMGAPTIGMEKIVRGDEGKIGLEAMQEYLGVEVAATVPFEVGGGNSFNPMIAACQLGLPMIDGDGMGRAFPEIAMISFYFDGRAPSPIVMVDALHRKIIIENIVDSRELERVARAMCVQLGGSCTITNAPITMKQVRERCIPNTISLAHRVGTAVFDAQTKGQNPVEAVCEVTGGKVLFTGKVTDVHRRVERGYNFGHLTLSGLDAWQGSRADIDLQNEYLICRVDGEVATIVPDLITMVDSDRGLPVTTEIVRYGTRGTIIGIPAPVQLTTTEALRFVGPGAFGYDLPYTPLARLTPIM